MMDQNTKAKILLGRRNGTNEFAIYLSPQRSAIFFDNGNYEIACEERARDIAEYVRKYNLSHYEIRNGERLHLNKIMSCPQMPDNGEFAFRATLSKLMLVFGRRQVI